MVTFNDGVNCGTIEENYFKGEKGKFEKAFPHLPQSLIDELWNKHNESKTGTGQSDSPKKRANQHH